jgi:Trk K+ transport system NAD-binding subunit
VFEIGNGVASLIAKIVPADSPVVEHRIQDIDILEQCVVAVIHRDETRSPSLAG